MVFYHILYTNFLLNKYTYHLLCLTVHTVPTFLNFYNNSHSNHMKTLFKYQRSIFIRHMLVKISLPRLFNSHLFKCIQ